MKVLDSCLTIVLPRALEEHMVDHLLEESLLVGGFTTTQVEGHGQSIAYHGASEEVRGRARRVQIQIVMNGEDAYVLLDKLKTALPNREIAYWITPVLEFGRFA
jgi:nitrogen regulatory protein PII